MQDTAGDVKLKRRIGVISDIHADLASFQLALDRLDEANVDLVVCAGDLVERGVGDGSAVIDLLQRHSVPCVQGNHDENAIRHAQLSANFTDSRDDTRPLDSSTLEFLGKLPFSKTLTYGKTKIMLTHAIPSDNGGAVFRDEQCRHLSKRFKKDLARIEADVLIVGHTHYPFDLAYRGKRVTNPGSVCNLQSRDSHTVGILDLSDSTFTIRDVSSSAHRDLTTRRS
jgi:putative phosphoesterase